MIHNFRRFAAEDPFGRSWLIVFQWQQNGISIRHSDTVDVKFVVSTEGEPATERVIALPHPALRELASRTGRTVSDSVCMKLAALHCKDMIETWADMEKTLITCRFEDLVRHEEALRKLESEIAELV